MSLAYGDFPCCTRATPSRTLRMEDTGVESSGMLNKWSATPGINAGAKRAPVPRIRAHWRRLIRRGIVAFAGGALQCGAALRTLLAVITPRRRFEKKSHIK